MIIRRKILGAFFLLFFICSVVSAQGPEYYKKRRDALVGVNREVVERVYSRESIGEQLYQVVKGR